MTEQRGFLARLARDVRGNTLAIIGAALIPLAGMVGGGIDVSRMYIAKTRLQHACDAAALAGRKAMGGGLWNQTVNGVANYPNVAANQFFTANFQDGSYGSSNTTKAFSENAGKVSGTASVVLPMTLMRIFGKTTETISVTCDAEMRLPNTDVMFVLDNTGSMGSKAVSTDTQTKIEALRSAVKCFYEIVARLDTDEVCATGTPSGGVGSQTQVRFGFVPYDMNVRVGYLLPTEYFANSWPYQSRERTTVYGLFSYWDGTNTSNAQSWGSNVDVGNQVTINKNSSCNATNTGISIPADTYTTNGTYASWPDTETATSWRAYINSVQRNYLIADQGTSGNLRYCRLQYRERAIARRAYFTRSASGVPGVTAFPAWNYKQVTLDISGLKAGSGVNWNSSVTLPIGNSWSNMTATWDGCIEERATVRQSSYSPIPSGAKDLDIDSVPSSSDSTSLWAPALDDVIFPRKASYSNSGSYTTDTVTTFNNSYTGKNYTCPAAAHKMEVWNDASTFDSYVDSLVPGGNTYHDIGLLWGARLMSPTGIFASENAYAPGGGEIARHLIFMTDGDACTDDMNYQAYGISYYDRRQTDPSAVPTDGCVSDTNGTLTQQVTARTAALCTAIKNKNITLWVIWFGVSQPTIEANLKACATSDSYFFPARNAAQLQTTFASIANQISQLRLTK